MSKRQQRKLRELAALAHERTLEGALGALREEFERWARKEIDAFELSDKIHEFHNRTGRKIYTFFVGTDPRIIVARSIVDGILTGAEVGDEIMAQLSATIEMMKRI